MMAHKLASVFRAWCLAVVLLLPAVFAAEQKSPLLGLNRDQVIEQLGEPKNQLTAGSRVIMIFARERVTLRDGVVIEVEMLPPEAPPKRTEPPPAAPAPAATEPATPTTQPAVAPAQPAPKSAPAAPARADAGEPDAAAQATTAKPVAPVAPPEPKLSIKQVRPPGAPPPKITPKQVAIAPTTAPATKSTTSTAPQVTKAGDAATATPSTSSSAQPATPPPSTTPAVTAGNNNIVSTAASSATPPPSDTPAIEPAPADKPDEPAADATAKKKGKKSRRYTSEPDILEPEDAVFSPRTYVIAIVVVGFGLGFLLWQRRQRALELAATAVSRTPFPASTPASTGATFPASLLNELEWKRFEELVASYYSKTGVVAERTKAGPQAPVHIKISWKGEPRPFACVQCVAHPKGLIDAARIEELFNVLTAEDIRRGYVVTTGKFNVSARDFAEEKHITLMSGDIFLEKINALPGSARTELVQEFSRGDNSTPTCPKCDTKMVKGADPSVWVCKNHPEVTIPAWK